MKVVLAAFCAHVIPAKRGHSTQRQKAKAACLHTLERGDEPRMREAQLRVVVQLRLLLLAALCRPVDMSKAIPLHGGLTKTRDMLQECILEADGAWSAVYRTRTCLVVLDTADSP
jgi:hypothetical protein